MLIIFYGRQSHVKDKVNDTHKSRCSKVGLIAAGTLLVFLSVSAAGISIYFLVFMTKTTTTTTGKNEVLLTKTLFDQQNTYLVATTPTPGN